MTKKIPMRTCVATGERLAKKDLIRVVRTPDKKVKVDLTGKANGRGAYLKKNLEALTIAQKKGSLKRALNVEIEQEVYDELAKVING